MPIDWPPDDPGVGWTPDDRDGKRDWPTIIIGSAVVLVFVAAALLAVSAAYAQEGCVTRDYVLKRLAEKYHEAPALAGTDAQGAYAMDLLVSPERSWTVLFTNTAGCSSIVAAGIALMVSGDPPLPGKGM